jgi:glycerol-3-phosphate acyltransferase PlsY
MAIAMVLAYFAGSIPSGLWIGRWLRGVDLRDFGSGNLGATNAFRVLGKKLGVTVLLIDVLKGLLPVLLFPRLVGIDDVTAGQEMLVGGSAIAGHVLSCFVDFKGGKGVATALGVFLAIAPLEMGIILVLGVVIIAVTGYVSLASLVGATLLPFFLFFSGRPTSVLLVATLIAAIVIYRHRSNLVRLVQGRENRFYETNSGPEQEDQLSESIKER